jgi:hypothetical protein
VRAGFQLTGAVGFLTLRRTRDNLEHTLQEVNMSVRQFSVVLATATVLFATTVAQAQRGPVEPPKEFRIRSIKQERVEAPKYGGAAGELGGRPSTLYSDWLRIEVQFESRPEWSDDVVLKFYVLMGEGRDRKMFSGEVTHVNVQKGQQHYSAMFVHPNTVRRFGAGKIQAVAVQLFYQGRLIDQKTDVNVDRWWEQFSPVPGYVLNPLQSPWSVVAGERYEPIKATP